MSGNRKRPQVTFNMNNPIEQDLYNKLHALNPNISDAVKYVTFAYFYPPGMGHVQQTVVQQQAPENPFDEEEEIIEDVSGLPNL